MSIFDFFSKKPDPQPLWFHTDIHCHVLPDIDDGSPDVETSLQLIDRMHGWGIDRIFASPHVTDVTFPNTVAEIADARDELQRELKAAGSTVKLDNSAEYRIDDLFRKHLEDGDLLTLPGNLILIENAFIQEPWNLDQLIFDLQVRGFRPILVHPERYSYYYGRKSRYKALHDAGAMFQINLLSLAGGYGREEKQFAEYLIEKDLVDYIGTDLHKHSHADTIDRYRATKDFLRHRDALAHRVGNDAIPDRQ